MRQYLVLILKLYLEHCVRQGLDDHCHHLNRVFLRQSVSRFCQRSSPALLANYCVKTRAPSAVTATVCSKCALKLPSSVTAVQPSSNTWTPGLPTFTIGSIASTMPSRSF